ncbi:MAG: tRNA (N(6)-L-threonylcarbamoyladenosine(37)-C(2))-methylthiotransferase MtaB [Candidatus Cloacimonetes bacterium]|nr:tRNA (N(6)-L-threonylcarbamoyladenosine(37)-C(2))-methylthiotransferase MtaB [Candidatus Cloacimonadota bacterium]
MVRKTIAAITFGCKVNQYETACILDDFINAGYKVVDYNEPADIYIINTCTVTNRTDYKSRNAIRKAIKQKEENPSVKIVVTGCYAQRSYKEITKLGEVDLIIDNNSKGKILESINRVPRCNNWGVEANLDAFNFQDISKATGFEELFTTSMIDRTRAFIKIQDGCDYFCAYCAVPFGRGNPRSRKKENVLNQIKKLVENGYKEFVLGGINLGLYGGENMKDKYFLSHLLWDIEAIKGVELIRLSSIEPQLFDNDLLDFFKESKKLCPHFHIPLQVGCDELLTKMGRKYSTADFREIIQKIKHILPDVAIGIDVIVGLPGETDGLFYKTFEYLSELDFTYLHVFPYSKRLGTKAEKMNGHIHGKIIRERSKKLIELSQDKLQEYLDYIVKNNVGLKGIIEKKTKNYWTSLSDHYIRIYLKSDENLEKKYLHFFPISKKLDSIEVKLSD